MPALTPKTTGDYEVFTQGQGNQEAGGEKTPSGGPQGTSYEPRAEEEQELAGSPMLLEPLHIFSRVPASDPQDLTEARNGTWSKVRQNNNPGQ